MLASAVAGLAAPAGAFAANAPVVTISGVIKAPEAVSVGVLTLRGVIYPSAAVQSGRFTITVPAGAAAGLKNATLQVLSASGSYLGPVVLREAREAGHKHVIDDVLGLAAVHRGARINLGTLTAEDHASWFLARGASAKATGAFVVRAAGADGRPYGVGTLGLVLHGGIPVVKPKHARIATSGSPSASGADPAAGVDAVSCSSASDPADAPEPGAQAGTLPGQQLDCSGVPNLFNVDVNGNDVLNGVDTSSASEAASEAAFIVNNSEWWASPISWYAPGGITAQAVSNFLVPSPFPPTGSTPRSNLVPDIHVSASQFFPGDDSGAGDTVTADCEGLAWCTSALLPALTGNSTTPWSDTTPPFSLPAEGDGAFGDQLQLTIDPSGTYVPGQTVLLTDTNSSGQSAEIPAMVGPYPAVPPYVQGLTFSGGTLATDSAGNQVSASPSGTITLKVERPERLPLAGETSTSGVMDVAGLAYRVEIQAYPPSFNSPVVPCPQDAYSAVSGATATSDPSVGAALNDDTLDDFDPAAAGNPGPITFTVNLSACSAGNTIGLSWTPGDTYQVSVTAVNYAVNSAQAGYVFLVVAG